MKIAFGEGSEAHYTVVSAIADVQFVVGIEMPNGQKRPRVMVIRAEDDGLAFVHPDDPQNPDHWGFIHYENIKELTIL